MRELLTYTYWGTLLLVSLFLMFRFRAVDLAARIICLLVWLGMCTESVGYYAARTYRNNYPVYNLSVFIEFVLICLYFNYSIASMRRKHIGIYIAIIGLVLGISNTVFLQPLVSTLNSNFLFLECLVVICLSLWSFCLWLLIDADCIRFQRKVHFWLPVVLLFYQCATLSAWGVYDKFGDHENASFLDVSLLSINIITYLSFGLIFALYPKLRTRYVQPR